MPAWTRPAGDPPAGGGPGATGRGRLPGRPAAAGAGGGLLRGDRRARAGAARAGGARGRPRAGAARGADLARHAAVLTVPGTAATAEALAALADLGADQVTVVAGDAPDLPPLLVGKLHRSLGSAEVAVLPAAGGGLVALAARVPLPGWLLAAGPDLDDRAALDALRAAAPPPYGGRRGTRLAPGPRRGRPGPPGHRAGGLGGHPGGPRRQGLSESVPRGGRRHQPAQVVDRCRRQRVAGEPRAASSDSSLTTGVAPAGAAATKRTSRCSPQRAERRGQPVPVQVDRGPGRAAQAQPRRCRTPRAPRAAPPPRASRRPARSGRRSAARSHACGAASAARARPPGRAPAALAVRWAGTQLRHMPSGCAGQVVQVGARAARPGSASGADQPFSTRTASSCRLAGLASRRPASLGLRGRLGVARGRTCPVGEVRARGGRSRPGRPGRRRSAACPGAPTARRGRRRRARR